MVDGVAQRPSGPFDVAPAGWSGASSGYNIDVESGVGRLTVNTK